MTRTRHGSLELEHLVPVSKIRQYEQAQAQKRVSDAQVTELETQVEEQERRNLRLTRELNEEVALRARAEVQQTRYKKQIEVLTEELEAAKLNELPQPIKKPAKPRKASVKKRVKAKPVDPTPPPVQQSSRKRGTAK